MVENIHNDLLNKTDKEKAAACFDSFDSSSETLMLSIEFVCKTSVFVVRYVISK